MLLIGNFNWSVTVYAAALIATLPPAVVDSAMGPQMLEGWGCKDTKRPPKSREDLESLATWVLLIGGAFAAIQVIFYVLVPLQGLSLTDLISEAGLRRLMGLVAIGSTIAAVWQTSNGYLPVRKTLPVIVFAVLAMVSRDALSLTLLGRGELPETWSPDFSDSLVCASFQGSPELHSRGGRTSLIFHARLDGAFPEDRHVELVLPGSVLIEETRPGHLLFDLPRLSLAVWRAGVPGYQGSESTARLLATLRERLLAAHGSVPAIFSDSSEYRLKKVLGNPKAIKDVMVYFQKFELTTRFADHLWYVKNDKLGAVLDTGNSSKNTQKLEQCPISWEKSFLNPITKYLPVQPVAVTIALGSLITKLVFL